MEQRVVVVAALAQGDEVPCSARCPAHRISGSSGSYIYIKHNVAKVNTGNTEHIRYSTNAINKKNSISSSPVTVYFQVDVSKRSFQLNISFLPQLINKNNQYQHTITNTTQIIMQACGSFLFCKVM